MKYTDIQKRDIEQFIAEVKATSGGKYITEILLDGTQNCHIIFVVDGLTQIPEDMLRKVCGISYKLLPSGLEIDASVEQDGTDKSGGTVLWAKENE